MSRPAPAQMWNINTAPPKPLGTPRPAPGRVGLFDPAPTHPRHECVPSLIVQHPRKDPT